MKIIDFEKKGNVVRFYLGADDCEDYGGDDWNDYPYEHNAEKVYEEYIKGYRDVLFPFDYVVLEPCDGVSSSHWCKDDMRAKKVPCIVALQVNPDDPDWYWDEFDKVSQNEDAIRFYFGDKMEPGEEVYGRS